MSLLIEEAKQKNEKEEGAKFAFLAGSSSKPNKGKWQPCQICKQKNQATTDCWFKGKSKCNFYDKSEHKELECWKSPQNKEKRKVTKSSDKIKSKLKGKKCAYITKDNIDSDEELDKVLYLKSWPPFTCYANSTFRLTFLA